MRVEKTPLTTAALNVGHLRFRLPVFELVKICPPTRGAITKGVMWLSLKSGVGLRDFFPLGLAGRAIAPLPPIYHQLEVVTQPQP